MKTKATATYLTTLSNFLSDTQLKDLPSEVIDRGRWIIADSLVAIAAGMQCKEMKELTRRHLAGRRRTAEATVIGAGIAADPMNAALLNGTAGTWLELDEGCLYAKGHPGIQVVPAALAIAERDRCSGRDFLLALILGYEASARIGRATKLRPMVHPHGTYGAIGAAVAVAKLAGYGADDIYRIINLSSTLGLATSRGTIFEGVTVRNIYSGISGYMGILADQLIKSGFTGETDGVQSIYGSIYGDEFTPNLVIKDLGKEFLVAKNYFKIHSAPRFAHSALGVTEKLMAELPTRKIDPDEIERIEFKSFFMASTLSRKSVATTFDAKFSVPFGVASLIYHGGAGLQNYADEAIANPKIQRLAQRVSIEEDPAYTSRFPEEQICDVRVQFRNGFEAKATVYYMKGENENPHSIEELKSKFFDLAHEPWGKTRAADIFEGLMTLEEIADVKAFTAKYQL